MRCVVQIEIEAAGAVPVLDELRSRGAAHVLTEDLGAIVRVEGPGGIVVRLLEHRCLPHDRGVLVGLLAEAPSPDRAGTGLRLALARLLGERACLAGWRVARVWTVPVAAPPSPPGASGAGAR
ncbi:hypothetical protein ACQEU5_14155 [Marinactinospora thermotolerans]|uniref:Uncharacterized protein n=1 Tax=Marinactinospora thermotolerans DSM 45154 TaxID=1122192 RepID=A0A1T4RU23_9ACTN|nr:hypothetical protein [Marinactinospora thermotolerans]SKA19452.1 hypothetical protein SAMN02745673_02985 [Marinactinospora thermotolerans DSM 45154]